MEMRVAIKAFLRFSFLLSLVVAGYSTLGSSPSPDSGKSLAGLASFKPTQSLRRLAKGKAVVAISKELPAPIRAQRAGRLISKVN